MTDTLAEVLEKERAIVAVLPEIVEELGTVERAARWLGFHPNAVENWLRGKPLSDEAVVCLQVAAEILRERPETIPERFRRDARRVSA